MLPGVLTVVGGDGFLEGLKVEVVDGPVEADVGEVFIEGVRVNAGREGFQGAFHLQPGVGAELFAGRKKVFICDNAVAVKAQFVFEGQRLVGQDEDVVGGQVTVAPGFVGARGVVKAVAVNRTIRLIFAACGFADSCDVGFYVFLFGEYLGGTVHERKQLVQFEGAIAFIAVVDVQEGDFCYGKRGAGKDIILIGHVVQVVGFNVAGAFYLDNFKAVMGYEQNINTAKIAVMRY